MHLRPLIGALIGGALLLLVAGGYFLASRRFQVLTHPLVIILFVVCVGVSVSVFGEVVFRDGWTAVPGTARRAAIGGTFWGVLIAAGAWSARWGLARWGK